VDLLSGALVAIKAGLERSLGPSGWATVSGGRDLRVQTWTAQLSLRYEFGFMQSALGVSHDGATTASTQALRGSIGIDADHGTFLTQAKSMLRRGGLAVQAFLDVNGNGARDAGERLVRGVDVRADGGRIISDMDDSLTRIVDLEGYRSYHVEVSAAAFENVSWQVREKQYDVEVPPNQFVTLLVPVTVAGEVTGRLVPDSTLARRSIGGYIVRFVDSSGMTAATVITERDGAFYYLGLVPGKYSVALEEEQASKLGVEAIPVFFVIRASDDGDIVDGVDVPVTKAGAK
jgi:uncharacterized protein (DUF2141 family)